MEATRWNSRRMKAERGVGRNPQATSSRTWTKWLKVNSRSYWPSATSWKSWSRGVPSMIQSRAMRVMTAAGAPSTNGLRMAGRTTEPPWSMDRILDLQGSYDGNCPHVHRGSQNQPHDRHPPTGEH